MWREFADLTVEDPPNRQEAQEVLDALCRRATARFEVAPENRTGR